MKAEALKGHLDGLLLATLEGVPLHGYAMIQALRARTESVVELPSGTLYPALRRLERLGLIVGHWSTVDGRRRRTYELTRAGRDALGDARSAWQEFATAVSSLLGQQPAPTTP